jgi:ammonia channel protein AmtB
MCLAAASGGLTQCIVSGLVQMYNRHEHFNTNEMANAVLANLVAVTGCCPFVDPPFAILIGRKYSGAKPAYLVVQIAPTSATLAIIP